MEKDPHTRTPTHIHAVVVHANLCRSFPFAMILLESGYVDFFPSKFP